jgi:hypothetical protein
MKTRIDKAGCWLGPLGLLSYIAGLAAADPAFAPRYEALFRQAQAAYQAQPTNAEAAWKYARACYDRSEFATNETQRAALGKLGIAAARSAIALRPQTAPAYYYLGITLGVLADATRTLGGLKLVSEMEQSFKKARELDAAFDFAGPDRCLGLLYRDAPGWPISLGSRSKAGQHLEQARQRAGDYPENQLNLLVAWLKWGEQARVAAELDSVEKLLAQARTKLNGEEWALSWSDWNRVWGEIKTKLAGANRSAFQHKGLK